jgi:hypothetical protein
MNIPFFDWINYLKLNKLTQLFVSLPVSDLIIFYKKKTELVEQFQKIVLKLHL